jgi:hypothetical protein
LDLFFLHSYDKKISSLFLSPPTVAASQPKQNTHSPLPIHRLQKMDARTEGKLICFLSNTRKQVVFGDWGMNQNKE